MPFASSGSRLLFAPFATFRSPPATDSRRDLPCLRFCSSSSSSLAFHRLNLVTPPTKPSAELIAAVLAVLATPWSMTRVNDTASLVRVDATDTDSLNAPSRMARPSISQSLALISWKKTLAAHMLRESLRFWTTDPPAAAGSP